MRVFFYRCQVFDVLVRFHGIGSVDESKLGAAD